MRAEWLCVLRLWIAFSSLILLRIHSSILQLQPIGPVVNCFQFFNFIEDSQFSDFYNDYAIGCELLSVL